MGLEIPRILLQRRGKRGLLDSKQNNKAEVSLLQLMLMAFLALKTIKREWRQELPNLAAEIQRVVARREGRLSSPWMNTLPSKKSKAISLRKGIMELRCMISIREATQNTKKMAAAISRRDLVKDMEVDLAITTTTSKVHPNKVIISSRVAVVEEDFLIREPSISELTKTLKFNVN